MMISLKDILLEFVPYVSSEKIRQGLVKKHGSQELDSYTFGIELEYVPERGGLDRDALIELLVKNRSFQNWAEEHIQSERENLNRRWRGEVNDWDESYGPVDPDTWESENPEPEESDFNNREEFVEKHNDWSDAYKNVKWSFKSFSTSDFYESIANDVVRAHDWEQYIDPSEIPANDFDLGRGVKEAVTYISKTMGQRVTDHDQAGPDIWSVSPDGSNVEIRSKHLTQNDYGLVKQICYFVSTKDTHGGTSAHVHIGLPKDFDAFDLLSLTTLVDESSVKDAVGPDRQLDAYAKLRSALHRTLITRIVQEPKDQTTGQVPSEFVIKNEVLKQMMSRLNRYHGTNIASIDIGTAEFRYLSSDMAGDSNRFIGWIKYFIILPKIAKSKNKVLLRGINQSPESDHKTLVCVREPGQVRFFLNKETAKVSDLPSSDIKGAAEPEPTSPQQNVDPRIEKLRRLKDKLRAARTKIAN